jgi:hypothetical protein
MAVAGVFALAAFFLRDADWRVARWLWWLTALLAAATAGLVYLLATNATLYRAFFGGP